MLSEREIDGEDCDRQLGSKVAADNGSMGPRRGSNGPQTSSSHRRRSNIVLSSSANSQISTVAAAFNLISEARTRRRNRRSSQPEWVVSGARDGAATGTRAGASKDWLVMGESINEKVAWEKTSSS